MSKTTKDNLTWEQFRDSPVETQVEYLSKRLNLNENRREKARRIMEICNKNNGRFDSGGWPPSEVQNGRSGV